MFTMFIAIVERKPVGSVVASCSFPLPFLRQRHISHHLWLHRFADGGGDDDDSLISPFAYDTRLEISWNGSSRPESGQKLQLAFLNQTRVRRNFSLFVICFIFLPPSHRTPHLQGTIFSHISLRICRWHRLNKNVIISVSWRYICISLCPLFLFTPWPGLRHLHYCHSKSYKHKHANKH